jgi:predicted enzyme related to lactoylglutathione lyase
MSGGIDFKGNLTLALQVKDLKAAIEWYAQVLAFKVVYEVEEMGWCEVTSPVSGVTVGLGQAEEPKVGYGPVPTWGVNDIDAARAALEAKEVRFDGDTITIPGMVRLATFYDPDGNAFMLAQSLQQT